MTTPAGRLDKALAGEARAVQVKLVNALDPAEIDELAAAIVRAGVRRRDLAATLTQERFGTGATRG